MSKQHYQKHFKDKQEGFSFVEVLMAVTIFVFLVIGVLSMSSFQISSNSFLRHNTSALQLAEDGMELLNRVNYNTELAGFNDVVQTDIENYPGYQRQFKVQWDTDISNLQVIVFWQKSGINSKPVILNSRRTR